MNLPNKLSVLRICLVPVFVIVMMLPQNMLPYFDIWGTLLGALIFIVASLTDMLDGKIARKYNLITDFGKFIDPLADKFMVIGALLVLMYRNAGVPYVFPVLTAATMIIIFRYLHPFGCLQLLGRGDCRQIYRKDQNGQPDHLYLRRDPGAADLFADYAPLLPFRLYAPYLSYHRRYGDIHGLVGY